MANNATLNRYLNGYPDNNGNKKRIVVILNGPSAYAAGGCTIPALAHLRSVHQLTATLSVGTYFVIPYISGTGNFGKFTDVKLLIIDVATGLQPADTTDLSALRIRLVCEGTN
jgi:hypothetical protein